MKKISARQQQVYDFIVSFTQENGYPPTVREICAAVHLNSPSSVHAHLKSLEKKGYIQKAERKTRAISTPREGNVPIIGRVAAGEPIFADENIEGFLPFDSAGVSGDFFALEVKGDSMINAGILEGDYAIVRKQPSAIPGQIVVALIEEEATLKRFRVTNGNPWLHPENERYSPIDGAGATILGTLAGLFRRY